MTIERISTTHVPCDLCGIPTPMTVTKRCNRCWELEHRIEQDPDLAFEMLKKMRPGRYLELTVGTELR